MEISFRKFGKAAYGLWSRLVDIVGDVKIFKFPLFAVYDSDEPGMTGEMVQEAVESLKPGDVLLRGYDHYLDGHFIDGEYTHAGVYVGNDTVVHAISPNVQRCHPITFMQCDRIMVLRPNDQTLVQAAIEEANRMADAKMPYDHDFDADDPTEVYCFELAARCYAPLWVRRYSKRYLLGLVHRDVYLAKSFTDCEGFHKVFESNPAKGFQFRSRVG